VEAAEGRKAYNKLIIMAGMECNCHKCREELAGGSFRFRTEFVKALVISKQDETQSAK
jgi:ribosomal protein L37AE/L43A